jgi:hypothetical protein
MACRLRAAEGRGERWKGQTQMETRLRGGRSARGKNFFMGRHRGAMAMVLKATWRRGRLIDAVVLARGTVVAGIEMPRRRDYSHGGM